MKQRIRNLQRWGMLAGASIVLAASATPVLAQLQPASDTLIAGFGIKIRVPGGSSVNVDSDPSSNTPDPSTPSEPTSTTMPAGADRTADGKAVFTSFSGKYTEYIDDLNGYKIQIPVEFINQGRGLSTNWTGPLLNGSGTLISVTATPMSGVSSQQLYAINRQQHEKDPFYVDIRPVTVTYEKQTIPSYRMSEADLQQGTRDRKTPEDIHRWHLMAYGNGRQYSLIFSGNFAAFEDNKVQAVFNEVIDSFELVPIVP